MGSRGVAGATRALALIAVTSGCTTIFSLDKPVLQMADAAADTNAPSDTALACLATYDVLVAGRQYRFLDAPATITMQHEACLAEGGHLASFETAGEIDALLPSIGAAAPGLRYVGAVQEPDQIGVATNWFTLSGGVLPTAWASGEPSDGTDSVENSEQNVGAVDTSGMHDTAGNTPRAAICECDGITLDPVLVGYLDQ